MWSGAFKSSHRANAGMEAHKGATPNWDPRRCSCHHVVVACTMIALVVTDRANDRILISDASQLR